MLSWTVYDDENNARGTIEAPDRLTAQDRAQERWPDVIGLWIEQERLNP